MGLLSLAIAGCPGPAQFIAKGQKPPQYSRELPDESVIEILDENLRAVQHVIAHAVDVTYLSPDEKGKADLSVFLTAPGTARVMAEKFGFGTVFDLLAEDGVVFLYFPRDNELHIYSLEEGVRRTTFVIMVEALLRAHTFPADGDRALDARSEISPENGDAILISSAWWNPDARQRIKYDRDTLLLREQKIEGSAESPSLHLKYAEWTLVADEDGDGGIWWPMWIELAIPAEEIELTLNFSRQRVSLNRPPQPAVFDLDIQEDPHIYHVRPVWK